ncbi:MAG: Serpin [Nocardioides sp.]|nr:Serpin [Nocardioides sp.]
MLTRRDLMRSLSLAVMAVAVPQFASGCDSDSDGGGGSGGTGDSTDLKLVSSDVERSGGDPAAITAAVGSIHALGAGLYGRLSGAEGNLALSPYSVGLALALTVNGGRGTTRDEMLDVLATESVDELNGGLNALTQHLESLAGKQERADGSEATIALDSANALFGEKTETWAQDFLDTLAREYGAGMQTVDFKGAFEAARVLINDWVAEQTQDRIEDLIATGVLNQLTRLVLVNALYLKAPWEEPFEKDATAELPFHLAEGGEIAVPTMRKALERSAYGSGDGWRAVRLTYAGGDLGMTVVLPDPERMAELERSAASGGLAEIISSVRPNAVELTIPTWTFRTQASLRATLEALGMPTAFTGNADFAGMTTDEPLQIAAVIHQVFIAVDEEGTEAAAATAVVVRAESALAPGVRMVVDRPFLFVIHDVEHGTPLFVGRVSDPRG